MKRASKPRRAAPRSHLADAVYAQIKADIFDFRLLPGARFSENEIAVRARVSRTPVREALMRLAREGYLEVHARSGWSVHALDFDQFEHLYDLRVVLEQAVVQKLCAGDAPRAIEALKTVWLVSPRKRLTDAARVAELDEAFHATLVAAAGNPELTRVHKGITERIRILRRLDFTHPERIIYTYQEHGALLRAVLARDAKRAGTLLRAHIDSSKREVRSISLHRLQLAHRDAQEG